MNLFDFEVKRSNINVTICPNMVKKHFGKHIL